MLIPCAERGRDNLRAAGDIMLDFESQVTMALDIGSVRSKQDGRSGHSSHGLSTTNLITFGRGTDQIPSQPRQGSSQPAEEGATSDLSTASDPRTTTRTPFWRSMQKSNWFVLMKNPLDLVPAIDQNGIIVVIPPSLATAVCLHCRTRSSRTITAAGRSACSNAFCTLETLAFS